MTRLDFPSVNSEWQLTWAVFVYLTEIFFQTTKKNCWTICGTDIIGQNQCHTPRRKLCLWILKIHSTSISKSDNPFAAQNGYIKQKIRLVNGPNGNHSAVAKNWTIGAKTENLLNETPNGSQDQFPQYVTAH